MNKMLTNRCFLNEWKVAKLVLTNTKRELIKLSKVRAFQQNYWSNYSGLMRLMPKLDNSGEFAK